ncbi:K Homology domain-containing protein [Caenorhabditis elegans]|uniref:K Homology domain-containing protein n=1 Tax=Caenorhabditis elegans TaxID=6239 RepID=A9Z1L6_CAEEL|nr:K Homology domain-containing protein [Caenorhabditis elegans]CCD65332.1 K Homology domain-containing protein [Caenorhabditis elegans]|eukprot:NP_001122591.1 activating signal cointegrator 1 complex subunit 1 homolog [Caenorhabditis elegans]
MAATFPLSAGTYSINGRKYRKTAYNLKADTSFDLNTDTTFADTPDIYEDEASADCFAPPGLPELRKRAAKAKIVAKAVETSSKEPEPTEDDRIKVIGGKKWISSINVAPCFIGKLIGTNRRTLNSLENETQCRVKTPRRNENIACEISSIVSLECVQRCLDRLEIFIDDSRKTARVNHFVALPCDQHEVQENFNIFKQMVMESDHFDSSCKNSQLFTKPTRLHLTLSVARIFDDMDLQKAVGAFEILEKEIRQIKDSKPLIADIQGIDMMNDDPSQVFVLYAKVKGDKVQEVANYVNRRLIELGVSSKNEHDNGSDAVKLHMTLMNSRYVTQSEKSGKSKEAALFDAKQVLEDLKDSYFGTFELKEICLCPMSSNSQTSDGKFYDKLAIIKLA